MRILSGSSPSLHVRPPRDEMSLELAAAEDQHAARECDAAPIFTSHMAPDLQTKHQARLKEEQRAALLDGRVLLNEASAHAEEVERILADRPGITRDVARCGWIRDHYGDGSPEHLAGKASLVDLSTVQTIANEPRLIPYDRRMVEIIYGAELKRRLEVQECGEGDPDPKPPTAGKRLDAPRPFVEAVAKSLSDDDLITMVGQPELSEFDPELVIEVYSAELVARLEAQGVYLDAAA